MSHFQQQLKELPLQWYVLLCVCSLINWGLETKKWQLLIKTFNPLTYRKAWASVLSGVAVSQLLPYKTGEYLGRLMFVKEQHRINAGLLSIVGSYSQLLITLVFGMAGFIIVKPIDYANHFIVSLSLLIVAGLLFYWFLPKIRFSYQWTKRIQTALTLISRKKLLSVMSISLLRYLSFLLPYALLSWHFGLADQASLYYHFFAVSCIFFMQTVTPNFIFTDIALRLTIPVIVFSHMNPDNSTMDYVPGMIVYIFNVAFPMLTGTIIVMFSKYRTT